MEESLKMISYMEEQFGIKPQRPESFSPLVLAYIGDSIQDLLMRMMVVNKGNRPVNQMHHDTSELVQASAQSYMMRAIQGVLTPQELSIYKRGRNAKSVSPAKNQSITDYRRATGYEALMGYLYLKNDWKRMIDLMKVGLDSIQEREDYGSGDKQ